MNRRMWLLALLATLALPADARRGVKGCRYGRRASGKCKSSKG
jgi:hypothetical protein